MLRLLVCLLCLVIVCPARPRRVVSKSVPNQFRALALDKQKLTGLLGSRVRANSEGFLENVSIAQLLRSLNGNRLDELSADREFPGLYLDAAADAYEYQHDLQLRSQMDKVAEGLASFSNAAVAAPDFTVGVEQLRYARADLVGLLAYYRVTSNPASFATAQRLASVLLRLLASDENQRTRAQMPSLLAQSGLIEPFVRLYRLSGEKKYLDFCGTLARTPALSQSDLTDVSEPSAFVTALAALGGLAELYEVTGDQTFLRPVTLAWKNLTAHRISVAGAPLLSSPASPVDTTTTAAWLQFTFRLLRITGQPGYGDQLERTVYNQVLAAQDARNGKISPEVPLNGEKVYATKLDIRNGRSLLSEAKALALIPQLVWGRYDTGIAISLYTAGRAFFTLKKHGLVQIYSEGAFPQSGQLQLHVEPSVKAAQFPLRLRVPYWAQDFEVAISDIHLKGKPGDFIIIDREWKGGDTLRISTVLPLRVHHGYNQASEDASGDLVLARGPQLLAVGKTLNPEIPDLASAVLKPVSAGHFQIANYEDKVPQSFSGDQVYSTAATVGGNQQDLLLVPFADAVNYRIGWRSQPE